MAEEPIKIELRSARGKKQSLDEPLDLSVQITNISDRPIYMVGVLPGSEGLRFPRYSARIEGPSGPVEIRFPEAMDYARGLRQEDFVRLAPGESFDPQQGKGFIPLQQVTWFKPDEPGTYRLGILFDATAQDPRQWMGHTFVRDREQVEALIRQVPHVQVSSNTLEVEFD
jgi:hypothetical protein